MAILCLSTANHDAQGLPRFSIFPQIAIGGGWSCDFYVSNQGFATVTDLTISFFGDDGFPLFVQSNLGPGTQVRISSLNAGATQVVSVTGSGPVQPGYALLQAPAGSLVRATMVVRFEQNARLITQLGVSQQIPATHYSFAAQVDIARGVNTGMAFANPALSTDSVGAQDVIVTLLEADGRFRDSVSVRLERGAHTSLFLNDVRLFPGLDKFQGAVSVSAPSRFGLIGLRVEQGILASIAIDSGPLLQGFIVTSSVRAETEPNNSTGQAQLISPPAIISGVISTAGDVDLFSFSGKQGDTVSALVETQTSQSPIDSALSIENSFSTTLSANDQNGLIGQNDSFVQVVLPSDGTYYLRVRDAAGKGGADYRYQIHVNVVARVVPRIDMLTPNTATQGATVSLVITGTNLRRTTAVQFSLSSSITISNLQASDTRVTATVVIGPTAFTGSRQVSLVTTSGTTNSLPFNITAPVRIDSLSPNNGLIGTTVNLIARGSNLSGVTRLDLNPAGGVTVNNLQSTFSQVTAALVIAADAVPGPRQLSVTTSNGTSNALPFEIRVPVVIDSISPTSGEKGKTVDLVIQGSNLNGATAVTFDPSFSITVSNIQSSSTQVTASVAISEFASSGVRQVSVTTPRGVSNKLPFTVMDPLRLTSITPFRATPGTTVALTLRGTRLSGTTSIEFVPSAGLTVSNVQSTDTQITAQLAVDSTAAFGGRMVSVSTAAGLAGPLRFSITGPVGAANTPSISNLKVNAPSGSFGSLVTITGSFDFTDPDGDIFFIGALDGSALISFRFDNQPLFTCTINSSGDFLNRLGQTSGSVQFEVSFQPSRLTISSGTLPIDFSLSDAAGNKSAIITFRMQSWFCGIYDRDGTPDAGPGWESEAARRRRKNVV
jgi:hypothetical protein